MFEQSAVTMDPELGSASLLLDPQGIEALRALYTTYGRDALVTHASSARRRFEPALIGGRAAPSMRRPSPS